MMYLAPVLLITAALYAPLSTAYFCGYDDFSETHRARFEDHRDPARIVTTTHFGTSRYRPVQRAATYLTWRLGGGAAGAFRGRNLGFHLLAVSLIFAITRWLSPGSPWTAAGAALLFGVHPLANQGVAGAVFTNSLQYSLQLASMLFFFRSLKSRRWAAMLTASLLLIAVDLFIYEGVIVVFGFFYLYLFLWRRCRRSLPAGYLPALLAGTALVLAGFFLVRGRMVETSSPRATPREMVRNTAMYAGALLTPVDTILAHELLGTPLPPDIKVTRELALAAAGLAALAAAAAWLALRKPGGRAALRQIDWLLVFYLTSCIVMTLAPFLVVMGHPSETYLYVPAALYAILLSSVLHRLLPLRAYLSAVAALAILFGAATWVRNERVRNCGRIAESILQQLQAPELRDSGADVRLAEAPGEPRLRRYGMYGYDGLAAIDPAIPGFRVAQMALRTVTGNESVRVDVLEPERLRQDCRKAGSCFWVTSQGRVEDVVSSTGIGGR